MNIQQHYPLITVILNNYQNDNYIEDAIKSVVNQSYKNLQIIILDDCSSSQKVKQIYEKYQKMDSRIEVIFNQQNQKIFNSRMNAIPYIKGEYAAFLEGDDCYNFDFIRHMYFFSKLNNADVSVCNFVYIVGKQLFLEKNNIFQKNRYVQEDDKFFYLNFMFDSNAASYRANLTWNKLYKSKLLFDAYNEIKNINLCSLNLYVTEDFFTTLFFLKQSKSIYIDSTFIGNYYRRAKAMELLSFQQKEEYINELTNIYKLVYTHFFKRIDDLNTLSNFKETIINTFSTYFFLFQIKIKDQYINKLNFIFNEYELKEIKEKINAKDTNWNITHNVSFVNKVDEFKKQILITKKIEFNLDNSLYIAPFSKIKKYITNEYCFDLFLFALFNNKKITINYYDKNLKEKFFNFLNLNKFDLSLIQFKEQEQEYILSFNFSFDKIKLSSFNWNEIKNNSKIKKYLTFFRPLNENENKQVEEIFYSACLITKNSLYFDKKSVFNYDFSLMALVTFNLNKTKIKTLSHNSSFNDVILFLLNNNTTCLNNYFFQFEINCYKFYKDKFQDFVSDILVSNNLVNKLQKTFVNSFLYNYELRRMIPNWIQFKDENNNLFSFNLYDVWAKEITNQNRYFINTHKGIYKNSFFQILKALSYDKNIFNNLMYMHIRKHKKLLKLSMNIINKTK